MNDMTLDQLLEEADESEIDAEVAELEQALASQFSVSSVYEKHKDEMLDLVRPLHYNLPNYIEFEAYMSAHDGLPAVPIKRIKAKTSVLVLSTANPSRILIAEAVRNQLNDSEECFLNFPDDEFQSIMDDMDRFANWWEKRECVSALDLAKSVIVHTVLTDESLRKAVFDKAAREIHDELRINYAIADWRDSLPE